MKPQDISAVVQFHGHFCPGLAIGVRAAELALAEIGPHAADEEVVAIVETDMCGVDAIQFVTGCTFGKGNLIHLDYGKNAFTFIRRSDGKAIRLMMRPQSRGESNTEHREPTSSIQSGEASPEEHKRFQELFQQRGQAILEMPLNQLFEVQAVEPSIPAKARVRESIQCEACGEIVMETRIRLLGGRKLCIPCFEAGERRLSIE
ncbi:MAG: TraR/DksA C4-type zinc finger protein [Anaerolineales bacterium]|nr:TraR/DksA C4-type zinc finger protein [Anaerolineales bacterium]